MLVPARTRLKLPVSCLEQGRWDAGREHEHLRFAAQASDPGLRRLKRARANANAAAGLAARPDQGEVWEAVDERLTRQAVSSQSAALNDVYEARRGTLDELAGAIHQVDGQLGALAFVGGRPIALDLVGRADVFASLLPRLAQGYALDALGRECADPSRDSANDFLAAATASARLPLTTAGLGYTFALDSCAVTGSGLEHEDELVQLCAFPPGESTSRVGGNAAIARPSRRRRRAA